MSEFILQWFSLPVSADSELRKHARALWIVSWPFLAVVTAVLALAVVVEPATLTRRATTVIAVAALVAIVHAINRSGRAIAASWVLVVGLTVIVTQRAWITGGIHAPVALFYALFIVMAGALLGLRGSLVTAGVSLLGAAALTLGEARHWLTPLPGAGPSLGAFVFVLLAIGLALVLQTLITLRRDAGLNVGAVPMFVHDMKTPLQILIAHLELLQDHRGDEDAEHVAAAIDGAKTLNRLTNSLLDVTRLEAGRMPVRRRLADLGEMATAVVASFRVLQPARAIEVEVSGDTLCTCDPELIRRVVENLVSNAIKHTLVNDIVRVVVTGARDRVCLAVHDEGPGISPQVRARMFEPFNAAGLRSAGGFESSGLGLAFCRLAVEVHGGTIHVQNGQPRGSIFAVELLR